MRKVIAFVTALVLFLGTIFGIHAYSEKNLTLNNNDFGTWDNQIKFTSPAGIKANLNDDSLVVFGSSEFQHGKKTKFYPRAMFHGFTFNPMLIGAAYYQSLTHTITLGAIGNDIPNKKVVLFVSPTWFRKDGIKDKAFASRFSESTYLSMLKNSNVSDGTKNYIRDRVDKLMQADPPMLKRVQLYNSILLDGKTHLVDELGYHIYDEFLNEKNNQGVIIQAKLAGLQYNKNNDLSNKPINWNGYLDEAGAEGAKTNKNQFYMNPKNYANLEARIKGSDGKTSLATKFGYLESPEYDDFKCFLNVCKELDVEPLIVMLPVNGFWYDYNGLSITERDKYYNNIRKITTEFNVELADLSENEYTKYFFEDGVHLSGKGWVIVNETIYNFYNEAKK